MVIEIALGVLLAFFILVTLPLWLPLVILLAGTICVIFVGYALHQAGLLVPILMVAGVIWFIASLISEIARYRQMWRKRKETKNA